MSTTATAVEPSRVLILDEDEQRVVIEALSFFDRQALDHEGGDNREGYPAYRLNKRIAYGEEYLNEADELARITLRKRRLEGEIRRINTRIGMLNDAVVEQWAQDGLTGMKHAGTGANMSLRRDVWAKLDVDTDGLDKQQAEQIRAARKAEVAAVMQRIDELADLVRPDFNLSTLSAVFRERIRAYDEEQRELPEHERTPRDAEQFLPDELRGLLRIDVKPQITVRAGN